MVKPKAINELETNKKSPQIDIEIRPERGMADSDGRWRGLETVGGHFRWFVDTHGYRWRWKEARWCRRRQCRHRTIRRQRVMSGQCWPGECNRWRRHRFVSCVVVLESAAREESTSISTRIFYSRGQFLLLWRDNRSLILVQFR